MELEIEAIDGASTIDDRSHLAGHLPCHGVAAGRQHVADVNDVFTDAGLGLFSIVSAKIKHLPVIRNFSDHIAEFLVKVLMQDFEIVFEDKGARPLMISDHVQHGPVGRCCPAITADVSTYIAMVIGVESLKLGDIKASELAEALLPSVGACSPIYHQYLLEIIFNGSHGSAGRVSTTNLQTDRDSTRLVEPECNQPW